MSEAGPGEGAGQYLQFVTDPGPGPGGDLGAFTSGQAPVYVSPSLYPSSSSPSTTTYYDTTSTMAGGIKLVNRATVTVRRKGEESLLPNFENVPNIVACSGILGGHPNRPYP